jgi:hypothetical protein
MGKHGKTLELLDAARGVLAEGQPQTLRQVHYRLVTLGVIENTAQGYARLGRALVDARKEGAIAWDAIEDRTRLPREVQMWADVGGFVETVKVSYRLDVWATQPAYLEAWLEKDTLSVIVADVLQPFGVTLQVGRGYDGWSSIRGAAQRYGTGKGVTVLYLGDHDPSGEDMQRSLAERLAFFGSCPTIVKVAIMAEDVTRYNLPTMMTKTTDTRRAGFVAQHGDACVELDALPVGVLRERIQNEVMQRMDLDAMQRVQVLERADRARLSAALGGLR